MNSTGELLFDWLFNASVQIGLFAIFAAILSPYTAKAKAKYQHCLYLAVVALCLTAPVLNTLWRTRVSETAGKQPILSSRHFGNHLWLWNEHSKARESILPLSAAKAALLVLWQGLFLY